MPSPSGSLSSKNKRLSYVFSTLVAFSISLLSLPASGKVIETSCQQDDVQTAINSADPGDTVLMRPGTCTWTNPPDAPSGYQSVCVNKPLSLMGSGELITIVVDDTDMSYQLNPLGIQFESDVDTTSRISGFTLQHSPQPQDSSPAITVQLSGEGHHQVRIDHITIDSIPLGIRGHASVSGVIDHVTAINSKVLFIDSNPDGSDWLLPLKMGSADAWFVEDSTFSYSSWADGTTDGRNGAKLVFRYNSVILPTGSSFSGSLVGNHGYDSSDRSHMSLESYENVFLNDEPSRYPNAMQYRGGTGVVFRNVLQGPHWRPIAVTNYRSCTGYLTSPKGMCDGSIPTDGNLDHGWPCRDQIGRSGGIVAGQQTSDPLYQWDNLNNDSSVVITTYSGSTGDCSYMDLYHIKPGRDYFDDTPRPAYIPYPYPHPLTVQGESDRLLAVNGGKTVSRELQLSWNSITGAAHYLVFRDWQNMAQVSGNTWAEQAPAGAHVYMVFAVDGTGKTLAAEGFIPGVFSDGFESGDTSAWSTRIP